MLLTELSRCVWKNFDVCHCVLSDFGQEFPIQTSCFVIYQSFELANFCSFFEFIIIIRYVIVIIVPFKKNYRSRLVLWSPIGHVIGAGTRRSSITGFEFKLFVIGHLRHSHVYYTRLKASFSIFPKFLLKFIKSATTTNFNVQKKI